MKKQILSGLLAGAMLVSLAACGGSASTSTADSTPAESTADTAASTEAASTSEGGNIYGYTCMQLTNPFHIAMRDELKKLSEADGNTLLEFDGNMDQQKQNDAIDDMIAQGMKVLFLNPVDQDGVQPALEACAAAGVKVITVDSNVTDTSLIETYISSNNYTAGLQCGEEIVKLYPDGCNIALIENPLADSVVQRVAGLEAAIEGTNCKIVDRKSIATLDEVLPDAEDILTANDDLQVFWGLNDDVSMTILGTVESRGRQDEIKVMSVDGSPSAKTSVQEGGLYCTAAQSPVSIADKAYECATKIMNGESVDATYSLDTTLITPDNVADNDPSNWG